MVPYKAMRHIACVDRVECVGYNWDFLPPGYSQQQPAPPKGYTVGDDIVQVRGKSLAARIGRPRVLVAEGPVPFPVFFAEA